MPSIATVILGTAADEAFKQISCYNPSFVLRYESSGADVPTHPVLGTPREMIKARIGGDHDSPEFVEAMLAGPPGEELVVGLRRQVHFAPGQEPTMASVLAELKKKYGLTENVWYRPQPDPIIGHFSGVASDMPAWRCVPNALIGSGGSLQTGDARCGFIVVARVYRAPNPELAAKLDVIIQNGPVEWEKRREYEALVAGADQNQREQEVERARQRGAPKV
jgi:hypothetical protein